MKTLQDYIDKLNSLNFKEMYNNDFFWTWDKDIYFWSSAGKSGTIFSGRGDGTEWIRLLS